MKVGVAIVALVACVLVPAVPLLAQGQATSADGPIARVVSRESVRLAADSVVPGSAGAEPGDRGKSSWRRVLDVDEGTEIIVTTRESRRIWGLFVGADQSSLTFVDAGAVAVRIARDDVADLTTKERRVWRGTRLGAIIGASAGFVLAVANSEDCSQSCWFTPMEAGVVFAIFGGAYGSGIGALVGALHKTPAVIYRAP